MRLTEIFAFRSRTRRCSRRSFRPPLPVHRVRQRDTVRGLPRSTEWPAAGGHCERQHGQHDAGQRGAPKRRREAPGLPQQLNRRHHQRVGNTRPSRASKRPTADTSVPRRSCRPSGLRRLANRRPFAWAGPARGSHRALIGTEWRYCSSRKSSTRGHRVGGRTHAHQPTERFGGSSSRGRCGGSVRRRVGRRLAIREPAGIYGSELGFFRVFAVLN